MISVPTVISTIATRIRNNTGSTNVGTYATDAPFFDFGHHTYISNVLKDKSQSSSHAEKVFPFIALILDIPEDRNTDLLGYAEIDFNIVLATATNKDLTNTEKETQIFNTILYPLYEDFLVQMFNSRYFRLELGDSGLYIPHKKTDMYFYNSAEGHNKWNRFVDAIEIQFRNVKLNYEENC